MGREMNCTTVHKKVLYASFHLMRELWEVEGIIPCLLFDPYLYILWWVAKARKGRETFLWKCSCQDSCLKLLYNVKRTCFIIIIIIRYINIFSVWKLTRYEC